MTVNTPLRWIIALAALAISAPALAQDSGGETICIGPARLFSGSLQDNTDIATTPVPESFRRLFEGGPCTRFGLMQGSLTSWHLAFGNEATVTAALAWFEKAYFHAAVPMEDLAARLAAARSAAQPDIEAARRLSARPGGSPASERLIARSKPIARLRELLGLHSDYVFLAGEYVRAAEFHGSRALFDGARKWFEPVAAALPALRDAARVDIAAGRDSRFAPDGYAADQATMLEIRMAIVQAALSNAPADRATAEALLAHHANPQYRTAAEEAFRHGDDFCDIGERSDLADYSSVCRSGNFEREAVTWWRFRAQLDLIDAAAEPDPDFDHLRPTPDSIGTALRLLEQREQAGSEDSGPVAYIASTADARVALLLQRADVSIRIAGIAGIDPDLASDYRFKARQDLLRAEAIAPASETPARFRQIATRFLRLWEIDSVEAVKQDLQVDPALTRKAAYFRAVLGSLDDIAIGRLR